MTKPKQKNEKNKKKKRDGKPRRPRSGRDPDCAILCRALCSTGFKYPDACSEKTICAVIKTTGTLTTNSAGRAAFACAPGKFVDMFCEGTYTSDTVSSWSKFDAATYDSMNFAMQGVRVVGAYIRAYYIHSSLENQGRISIKSDSASTATWPSTDNPNSFASVAPVDKHGPITEGCYVMATPADSSAYDFFRPPHNVDSNTRSWGCHYIFIEGAKPSTTVMQVEVTQFVEMKPDSKNFIARMATQAAPDSPKLRGRLNTAYTKIASQRRESGLGTWDDFISSVSENLPTVVRAGRVGLSLLNAVTNNNNGLAIAA